MVPKIYERKAEFNKQGSNLLLLQILPDTEEPILVTPRRRWQWQDAEWRSLKSVKMKTVMMIKTKQNITTRQSAIKSLSNRKKNKKQCHVIFMLKRNQTK